MSLRFSPRLALWLSWIPAISCMAFIFYLSSLPGDQVHLPDFWNSDKLVHFFAYSVLGFLIASRRLTYYRLQNPKPIYPSTHEWISIPLGALYGVSDEIHQRFVPLREYSYWDMTADTCGIIAGYFLFQLLLAFVLRKKP